MKGFQEMIGRTTRNKVERILGYISEQEQKCCWSGTSDHADALRLAWWTVWFAAYQESSLPFDAALRKVLGPRYSTYQHKPELPPPAPRDPIWEVDGRNGLQWVRSVLAYLDWRSGSAWRPARDRNHPLRRFYTDASLTMREAFFHPQRARAAGVVQDAQLPPAKPVRAAIVVQSKTKTA